MKGSTRAQAKVRIFFSDANPLWAQIGLAPVSNSGLSKILGVSDTTIGNWNDNFEGSRNFRKLMSKATKSFITIENLTKHNDQLALTCLDVSEICKKIDEYCNLVYNNNVSAFECMNIFNIDVERAQIELDKWHDISAPLLPGVYFERRNYRKAIDVLHELKGSRGIYYAYIWRNYGVYRSVLQIRHLKEIGNGFVIRCKLNIPIDPVGARASGERKSFEYDGFAALREGREIFWTFEKRDSNERDWFYFITKLFDTTTFRNANSDVEFLINTTYGMYLTAGQTRGFPISTGFILLTEVTDENLTGNHKIMQDGSGILNEEERIEIEKNLDFDLLKKNIDQAKFPEFFS